jgi:enoyl-CoA hydratase
MSTTLEFSISGPIARLTFTSPNGVNILSTPVFDALEARLGEVAMNPDVRVLVITGSGKTFLAGADISEMSAAPVHAGAEFARRGRRAMDRIAGLESAVTIAAINGGAFGGGCELAVACDLRIMSDKAKIGLTETKLGLVPGWGGMQRVLGLVGPARARRMVFTADVLDAATALGIGLVNEVAPAEALNDAVDKLAEQITATGPHAVRVAKRCLIAAEQGDMPGALMEAAGFGDVFAGPQGREGLAAFLEKRAPKW